MQKTDGARPGIGPYVNTTLLFGAFFRYFSLFVISGVIVGGRKGRFLRLSSSELSSFSSFDSADSDLHGAVSSYTLARGALL